MEKGELKLKAKLLKERLEEVGYKDILDDMANSLEEEKKRGFSSYLEELVYRLGTSIIADLEWELKDLDREEIVRLLESVFNGENDYDIISEWMDNYGTDPADYYNADLIQVTCDLANTRRLELGFLDIDLDAIDPTQFIEKCGETIEQTFVTFGEIIEVELERQIANEVLYEFINRLKESLGGD